MCLSFLKWQPQARPAIVGGHDEDFFPFKKQMMVPVNNLWQFLPWYYYVVFPLHVCDLVPCLDPQIFLIKLTSSCIAFSIIAMHAFPYRVASMPTVRGWSHWGYDIMIQRYRKSHTNIKINNRNGYLPRTCSKLCVKFQSYPLNFHTILCTHTPKNLRFTRC